MPTRRGLLVDYGGVLTTSMLASIQTYCDAEGLPRGAFRDVIVEAYASHDGRGLVERLEIGRLDPATFGRLLAAELERRCGVAVEGGDLVARIFGALAPDDRMLAGVARARARGVRTALVSNSWGEDTYPRERYAEAFDAVVISGEVGVRKPDPAIFEHALRVLDLPAQDCVFVDDLPLNVRAAEALGMAGVVHADTAETLRHLTELLGLPAGALEAAEP